MARLAYGNLQTWKSLVHHFTVQFSDCPHPDVSLHHLDFVQFCSRDPCVR